MNRKVKLSTWCFVITLLGLTVLFCVLLFSKNTIATLIVCAALVVLCGAALFYMPLSISVDKDTLNIHRSLRIKSIPLDAISSVELCAPTMAERRIFGSGGWFGYWGWFKEPLIGKYFAYYGKASDCFLVTLKDGRKYLLGCADPAELVEHIQKKLN